MPYILNIETATKNCSVAVAKGGKTIICREVAEEGYSHAEKLHVFIEQSLQELKLTFKDLSAIAVSKGPGSYTGLRIGVSAAKGLCYALEIPLIAVDTLAVLAAKARIDEGIIIPMIDARRMEVYCASFDSHLTKTGDTRAEILTRESFKEIEGKIYFIGDSAEKAKSVLIDERFIFLDEIKYPSANEMSALSFKKYLGKDFADTAYFEPYYLKDFMVNTPKK